MDPHKAKTDAFREQRMQRIIAVREEQKEERAADAREARQNELDRQNAMITYEKQISLYEQTEEELNELAYEIALENMPTAEDAAVGEAINAYYHVENKRRRLESAEECCKELYAEEVESLKRLKEASEEQKEEDEDRLRRIREIEKERSKIAVQRHHSLEQLRSNYLLEEKLEEEGEEAKIRAAEGAIFNSIEKQEKIPITAEKETCAGLEIIPEWIAGDANEVVSEEDAFIAAENKKAFGVVGKAEVHHFDSEKHVMKDRISEKAQEAISILEEIKNM